MRIDYLNINGNQLGLSNLNIIIGPNGIGKTTLLANLYESLLQKPAAIPQKWPSLLMDGSVLLSQQEISQWLHSLEPVQGQIYGNNKHYYADPKSLIGNKADTSYYIMEDELQPFLEHFPINGPSHPLDQFNNNKIRKCYFYQHTAYLTVDERFYLSQNSSGPLALNNNNILNIAPYLAKNKDTLKSINKQLSRIFGRALFPETRSAWNFDLYTAPVNTKKPKRYMNQPENYAKISKSIEDWINTSGATIITQEGHGIRAATQILFEPSAKHKLGQLIASFAKKKNKQIILTTHDSDLLRGIIEGYKKATVIRIDAGRNVNYVQSEKIRQTTALETLQSAFSDYAIITEGIQDAYVYEGAITHNNFFGKTALQFVPANGKENVSNDFYFYQALGIKFAAIYDYDVLFNTKKRNGRKKEHTLKKAIQQLKIDPTEKNHIFQKIDDITDFSKNHTDKKHGLRCKELSEEEKARIKDLLQTLTHYGIFVCPFGELEDWVKTTKQKSTPERILQKYKSRCKSTYKDLTIFLENIKNYLLSS